MTERDDAATTRKLSPGDIDGILAALNSDGYSVLRGVVDPEPLEEFRRSLLDEYERLRASDGLFEGGGMITGHLNCYPGKESRFIYDQIRDYGIVDVAAAFDAEAAKYPRPTLNFNLPGSVAQHYHMDGVYTKAFLVCNIAVVDTNIDNGAFDVLPGTNREFLPFWRYAMRRTYRLSTRVPLQQGDVILRLSTTWHRGTPNRTETPRPMMSITFGELGPADGDPWDGDIAFYPNWFNTDRIGQLREHTFKVAPISYSAFRFVRSLWGNKGYDSF